MKSLLTTALLLVSLLGAGSVLARLPGQVPLPLVAARPAVRPLTRYLAAVLRLTPKQAAAVQQALRTSAPQPLAPEALALCLSSVLSLEAQERLQTLQNDATTYRALYYLAARH